MEFVVERDVLLNGGLGHNIRIEPRLSMEKWVGYRQRDADDQLKWEYVEKNLSTNVKNCSREKGELFGGKYWWQI